ncbi:ABC transporter ATP-binding protein [Terracoccus luteus]|uniref:ABC-2 type transport system ATP-binding protein n=1 Tax=Terracoccus luteus TaxID=53356 RepID=A0A839PWI4_9MICO|nr:ATP-binding cassette domain-containing protein [Terracoccus luteus]MBB2987867.1 ABC-2 type transport system ATP-binding protein [Terracoccus luteus]MCP2173518.1 ABC-2 type transport system ATP-binding protein [Terracoccus luteus]
MSAAPPDGTRDEGATTPGDSVIRTTGLTKRYGALTAVDAVDLDVRAGDVYGFLGANGSGKTTTVRCLLGLVLPTSGRVELLGRAMPRAAAEVLPRVGALVEGPAAYGHLSGRANLELSDASGRRSGGEGGRRARRVRAEESLERVGLGAVGRRPVRAYSLGMRQRLGLAAALMRRPRLLVLDEPTNGLDPQGIREIRELLLELNRSGTTVFLSSHLLAEVEQLCTRIGLLDRGRLVLEERLDVLQAPTGHVAVQTTDAEGADRAVALLGDAVVSRTGRDLLVSGADPATVTERLVGAGVRVQAVGPERLSLEQVVEEHTRARAAQEVPT